MAMRTFVQVFSSRLDFLLVFGTTSVCSRKPEEFKIRKMNAKNQRTEKTSEQSRTDL